MTVTTQVCDAVAVALACQRLKLPQPVQGTTKLFSGEVHGVAVQLPGWRYPIVCDTGAGKVNFDNYEGRWGERAQLDSFLQAYAVEKAKLEARRKGHSVSEQALPDGSIKLSIQTGGAA